MDTTKEYEKLATVLYDAYKASECGDYMVERVKKLYYGMMVKDNIHKFKAIHDVLVKNGHTAKNPYVYGDMDQGVWFEKGPDEFTAIIITERYCSAADDNTYVFKLRDYNYDDAAANYDDIKFVCSTVYPRQKTKSKRFHNFGDHRDIVHPSINTYRKCNFKYGYEDGRDDNYCFNYDALFNTVEDAHWKESRIVHALDTLDYDYEALVNNYADFKCN